MHKIGKTKLVFKPINTDINGKRTTLKVPEKVECTFYEQSGEIYYSLNGERPIPLYLAS